MVRRPEDSLFEEPPVLGHFGWKMRDGKRILLVVIPCPGRDNGIWSEWSIDHRNHCGAQWSWNGNEDKPTLSPSLHAVGVWHGWVRDGQLIEA